MGNSQAHNLSSVVRHGKRAASACIPRHLPTHGTGKAWQALAADTRVDGVSCLLRFTLDVDLRCRPPLAASLIFQDSCPRHQHPPSSGSSIILSPRAVSQSAQPSPHLCVTSFASALVLCHFAAMRVITDQARMGALASICWFRAG